MNTWTETAILIARGWKIQIDHVDRSKMVRDLKIRACWIARSACYVGVYHRGHAGHQQSGSID